MSTIILGAISVVTFVLYIMRRRSRLNSEQ
jgi:hypothetical protein